MTAYEAVQALYWPGHLGDTVACGARLMPAPEVPTDDHLIAVHRYGSGFDCYRRPWLAVGVYLRRLHSEPGRHYEFIAPGDAKPADVIRDVHAAAMWLLQQELYASATFMIGRSPVDVWDAETLPVCPDQGQHAPAQWMVAP